MAWIIHRKYFATGLIFLEESVLFISYFYFHIYIGFNIWVFFLRLQQCLSSDPLKTHIIENDQQVFQALTSASLAQVCCVYVESSGSVWSSEVVFVEGGQGLIPATSATRPEGQR